MALTDDWKDAALTLLGGVVGLGSWVVRSLIRRLERLEESAVRTVELDQLRRELDQRHTENTDRLRRIESLIERNHVDSSQGRHDVRNQVTSLMEKVGRIEGRLGIDEFERGTRP